MYEASTPSKRGQTLREESFKLGLLILALAALGVPGALPAQSIRGQVLDQATNAPVGGVTVTLLDSAETVFGEQVTQEDGRFALSAPGAGRYRLRFQVPGYRMLVTPLLDLPAGGELDYPLTLRPIPPTLLDTLLVEGQPVPWNLVGFYQRRRRGLGDFATREEWDQWAAIRVEDVVRHINPFVLLPNAGRGTRLFGSCAPAVFLDDLPLAPDFDLSDLFLEQMAAIEVYRSPSVPPEFDRPFGVCAVIALWSRLDVTGQPRRLALGVQVGGAVAGVQGRRDRVGIHAVIGLEGPIELYPVFNAITPLVGDASGLSRSGWEAVMAVRVRPLGRGTGWYVGLGWQTSSLSATSSAPSTSDQGVVSLSGFELIFGGVRPFVELEVLGPFRPSSASLSGFVGVTARIY